MFVVPSALVGELEGHKVDVTSPLDGCALPEGATHPWLTQTNQAGEQGMRIIRIGGFMAFAPSDRNTCRNHPNPKPSPHQGRFPERLAYAPTTPELIERFPQRVDGLELARKYLLALLPLSESLG